MRHLAPAKINLHLRVGPRRPDGFHDLASWMTTVSLYDRLILRRTPGQFSFTCDDPTIPDDATNLVVRAADAFAAARNLTRNDLGVSVTLLKQIPHGAGLGGGSSDAATMLMALDALANESSFSREDGYAESASAAESEQPLASKLAAKPANVEALIPIAATLGSDIPFFLHAPAAVIRGRGERVTPCPAPPLWAVLILPPIAIITAACYRKFDEMHLGRTEDVAADLPTADWSKLGAAALAEQLVNDLELPAFALAPQLAKWRDDAEKIAARPVRMSGSGSSLFMLADSETEAVALRERLATDMRLRAAHVAIAPHA